MKNLTVLCVVAKKKCIHCSGIKKNRMTEKKIMYIHIFIQNQGAINFNEMLKK